MTPVSTEWSVYSETGVPAWGAAFALVALLALLHRWLRYECRRRPSGMARILPLTLVFVVMPAVAILSRPVITRVQTFEHTLRRVAVIDGSRSMDTPLTAPGLARRLDLVALWDGRPIEGRSLAARSLAEALAGFTVAAQEVAASLDRSTAEAEQGLPPGPDTDAAATRHAALVDQINASLGGLIADLQSACDRLPDGEPLPAEALAEPLAAVEASATGLTAPYLPAESRDRDGLSARLAKFFTAVTRIAPLLDALQDTLDEAFMKTPAGAMLTARLAEAAGRTRRELAVLAAAELPRDVAVITAANQERLSDIYQMVRQAVADGDDTSDVVLLSDGAHNGGTDDAIVRRLADRGVRLSAVPAGMSGVGGIDGALIDWRLPRVLVAGKPAVLHAMIKASPAVASRLSLRSEGETDTLASVDCAAGDDGRGAVALSFTVPAAGRRLLRLSLDCPGDAIPANNSALLAVDVVPRSQRFLLIDDVPSWDAVWLARSAKRQGIDVTQVHVAGTEPKRGGLSRSVPQSLMQWTRYRGVILDGPAFPEFSAEDAAALRAFVMEKGGTLLLLAGAADGYDGPLGKEFSFAAPPAEPLSTTGVRLAKAAAEEPSLRLASDGEHAARIFASLPPTRAAYRVPPGDIVLVETAAGEPVCSLAFHGRGKLIHWGLRGMERMRGFAGAAVVDRLLEGLVGEMAASLFVGQDGEAFAFHPPLPRIGSECLLVTGSQAGPPRRVLAASASTPVDVDGRTIALVAHDNPGIEMSLADVDESFLRGLVDTAQGRLVRPDRLGAVFAAEEPRTYTTQTSESWPVGRSPLLVGWLATAAAVHWVFRKLAGLAM